MSKSAPVLTADVPEYVVDREPNHQLVGKAVDDVIRQRFLGKTIVARGISSSAHPDKTIDGLIEIIQAKGTDRYDPKRPGDRYENVQGKHIDLFAFRRRVTSRMRLFEYVSWGFYHGSREVHGEPVRIDLLTIYDALQLRAVVHQYEGRSDVKRDGFVFKDPANKKSALLAIIKIT